MSERELAHEANIVGPQASVLLGTLCNSMREWQGSLGPFLLRPGSTGFDTVPDFDIETIRLNFNTSEWKAKAQKPYQGIFSTGPVNSGIRAEIGPSGEVAVLVEAPDLGDNGFRVLSLQQILSESSKIDWTIDFVLDQPPGTIVVGESSLPLPSLTELSCSLPRLGVGFSDERTFSGVIDLSFVALGSPDAGVLLLIRSLARVLLVVVLALSGAIWLCRRAREELLE